MLIVSKNRSGKVKTIEVINKFMNPSWKKSISIASHSMGRRLEKNYLQIFHLFFGLFQDHFFRFR